MKQILVRDLDVQTVDALKMLAEKHHRSLQSEAKSILQKAALKANYDPAKLVAAVRKKTKQNQQSDSAQLLRQDRDR